MLQPRPGRDQPGRRDIERVGAGDEVGLIGFEEGDDRGEEGAVLEPLAQQVGRHSGEREQARRARIVAQRPAERAQRQRLIVICLRHFHRLHAGAVGQKILVVEDNELNLKLFCDLLRAHGYAADPVRDGREAVARARDFGPELIVMDIQMPHISGLELIEQLKADADLRPIPIMAVTAYAAKGDEERIRDAGAEGYVSKPISVLKFVEAVRALLDAAAARAVEAPETEEAAAPEGEAAPETPEGGEDEGDTAPEPI